MTLPGSGFDAAPSGPGRVLVVDDNAANRELLRQELEGENFEVISAVNGDNAIELARSEQPEVILMDILMPGINGIEACRRLKQQPETSHIPVVFITANRTDEETTVEALAAGGNDFLPKPYSLPILLARVSSQITICRAHSRLRRMAMTDELTGVFSRRHLFASLRRTVKGMTRHGPPCLGCLVIDIDHFKRVNDTYGHLEGDALLRRVAGTIDRASRETDLVARFGGEEFVVLMPDTDAEGSRVIAERIRLAVKEECPPVTVSVGGTSVCEGALGSAPGQADAETTIDAMLRRADAAVYRAKQEGRNQVVINDDSTNASAGPGDGKSER